jgi:hypothetical protein
MDYAVEIGSNVTIYTYIPSFITGEGSETLQTGGRLHTPALRK